MGFIENFTKLIFKYGNQLKIKDKDKAILEIAKKVIDGGGSTDNKILTVGFVRVDDYNPTGKVDGIALFITNSIVELTDTNSVKYFGNLALCPDKFYTSFLVEELNTITKWNLLSKEDSTAPSAYDFDIIIYDEVGISEEATAVWCLVEKYRNSDGYFVKITYKAYQEGSPK